MSCAGTMAARASPARSAFMKRLKPFRRPFASILTVCVLAGCQSGQPRIGPVADPFTELQRGNARFADNKPRHPHHDPRWRHDTAVHGQHPWATVVSCSDSRVPVEMIFDAGLGDLFVVRVAGNVIEAHESGSVEYAVEHLHTPLVVIIGHEHCGAVDAVVQGGVGHGDMPHLVDHIKPVVARLRLEQPNLSKEAQLHAAVRENAIHSMNDLLSRSAIVREAVAAGTLQVRCGVYDIDTAKIDWIEESPGKPAPAGPTERVAH